MVDFVSNSVMPKGVEHSNGLGKMEQRRDVSNSVMPKGVEHVTRQFQATL